MLLPPPWQQWRTGSQQEWTMTTDDHQCHVTAAATTTALKACHIMELGSSRCFAYVLWNNFWSASSAKAHVALLGFYTFLMLYINFWWSTILSDTFWWLKHLNLLVNMSTKAYRHTKSIWKHKKAPTSIQNKTKITYSPRDVDVNISWAIFFSFSFHLVMLVMWWSHISSM